MTENSLFYIIIFLSGVFVSAISQVLLKKEAMKEHGSVLKEYLNPRVIIAYGIFFGATLLSILAYKGIPLSLGPVLEATSYIYITFFGVVIFKERMNTRKILAVCLIISGILVFALLG